MQLRIRKAFVLCVLVLLHEFAPAQLALIYRPGPQAFAEGLDIAQHKHEVEEITDDDDDNDNDDSDVNHGDDDSDKNDVERDESDISGYHDHIKTGKRGNGLGSVVKYTIKVFSFAKKVIPTLVTIASLSNAIFRGIAGCCIDYPQACEGYEEAERLRQTLEEKSHQLDNMQLEAQNMQEWAESTSNKFTFVLFELNNIVDHSEYLVNAISPDINIGIANKTTEIKELVRRKNSDELGFLEVESMYEDTIDTTINLAVPFFTAILPSLPGLVRFASNRLGHRKAFELDENLNNVLKKPPKSSPKFIESKSWMAKTRNAISMKLQKFRKKIETKYTKAVRVVSTLANILSSVFEFVSTAYDIYGIVESAQGCYEKAKNLKQALKEFKKANRLMDEAISNATTSKAFIEKVWEDLHIAMASAPLVKDLHEVRMTAQKLGGKANTFSNNVDAIGNYISNVAITRDYKGLHQLLEDLSIGLGSLPFTMTCYTNKVKMVEFVLRECERGSDTFSSLYSSGLNTFDSNAKECRNTMGFTYIDEPTLTMAIEDKSKLNNFNTDCVLNSDLKKSQACLRKDEGYVNSDIAISLGVTEEQVEKLVEKCPKHAVTPLEVKRICALRARMRSNDDIADILDLDVGDVEAVNCPKDG
ncbi:uncharacterized protein LOC116602237 [Nematostella vectensis]|uniref:uncharacterized protein LOC116602237 n=1 Tax=Nematostella vectensis TaxID=45351 RepID=UPI002076D760|nr:uncharacterized protein LOC116602237 [Nematostella vectensis]